MVSLAMQWEQRAEVFVQLGKVLGLVAQDTAWPGFECGLGEGEYAELKEAVHRAQHHNGWFTPTEVKRAFGAWATQLTAENLQSWLEPYSANLNPSKSLNVGIVMAGNIPLVGMHDLLCVLMAGHHAIVKPASDDHVLMPAVVRTMAHLSPDLANRVTFASKLNDADAFIATGHNNTTRYFQQYFGHFPHIIRGTRNSAAVVDSSFTDDDLRALGEDVFSYFGLGCRNVSKLFLPEDFDIDRFFKAIYDYHPIINHNKYTNNYDYYKALYLMNGESLLDNGFLLLRPDTMLYSTLGTLHFERYSKKEQVLENLQERKEVLQCVVGKATWLEGCIPPGTTQQPGLADYADGIDTMAFLTKELRNKLKTA